MNKINRVSSSFMQGQEQTLATLSIGHISQTWFTLKFSLLYVHDVDFFS